MSRDRIALYLILAAGAMHEFAWQAFGPAVQGDVRAITQFFLIAACLAGVGFRAEAPEASAVCLAVGFWSATTAMASAWWLIAPFETQPGEATLSEQLQAPVMLLSAFVAIAALVRARRKALPHGKSG